MLYEAFFDLRERPFAAAPQPGRYFPATALENARKTLVRCLERGEGIGAIIGPSGTGKTLLCQLLAEHFSDRFATVLLTSGRLGSRRALLQAILYELGLNYRGLEEGELRLSLIDYLAPEKQNEAGLVLLVDEAHTLPWRLLDELRMITNLVRGGVPRVRMVLAGGPLLEERFASPRMDSLGQRLAARCYLEALNREETLAYVRSQISQAGGEPGGIFRDDALDSVFRATGGVPRLVNQVCDHAMILASLGGVRPLTAAAIEEAWADLQQLPAPWNGQSETADAGKTVEFGGLDDEPEAVQDDMPEAIPIRTQVHTPHFSPAADQQIDRITEQLAELDEEFEPAGSIHPDVVLMPAASGDPFGEPFAEEEVLLDRFASLEADLFRSRQMVASDEGRELAAILGRMAEKAGAPALSVAAEPPDWIEQPPAAAIEHFSAEPAAQHVATAGDNVVPFVASSFGMPTFEASVFSTVVAAPDTPSTARVDRPTERGEPNDDDLIVIEDDAPPSGPAHVPCAPLVHRQEYRQLFSKMRRG